MLACYLCKSASAGFKRFKCQYSSFDRGRGIPVSPQPQNNHLCKLPQHKFALSLFHSRISKLKVPCIVLDDSGVTGTRVGGRAGGCQGVREGFYQSGLSVFLKLNKKRPTKRQTSPLLTIGFSYSLDPDSGFSLCLLQRLSHFALKATAVYKIIIQVF